MTPSPARTRELRSILLSYFDARSRDLPWRRTDDPYRIWVSEVMLQQTRVETVVPYYHRWLERFPDVSALAAADLDEVLKLWEGLGYYRRARMLHRAAAVVRDRGGEVPATVEALRELPGIGPYTAGAVASIAYGRAVPAVDGNARRVLARLFDLPDPTPAELRSLAAALVPDDRPGDFNQAVMELGSTVCTPRSPDCPVCPLEAFCRARAAGVEEERPVPRRRGAVPRIEVGVAVVVREVGEERKAVAGQEAGQVARRNEMRLALVRRPTDAMLGGLWEFPGVEIGEGEGASDAAARAARSQGIDIDEPDRTLEPVDHRYSHLHARYRPFLFRVRDGSGQTTRALKEEALGRAEPFGQESGGDGPRWMDAAALADAALPRAQRVIVDTVAEQLGL